MLSPAAQGPLVDALAALAGSPDENVTELDHRLQTVVKLTVALVEPIDYASVTARRQGALTTVAMSNALALAVDGAQYADGNGPCLDALAAGTPIRSDIATTINWPRFRDRAKSLGLRASLSIPLFAGRGSVMAALNLYVRDAATLDPLTKAVLHIFEFHEDNALPPLDQLDPGSAQLVCGVIEAFRVQQRLQVAIGLLISSADLSADDAYGELRRQSIASGGSLLATADEITVQLSKW